MKCFLIFIVIIGIFILISGTKGKRRRLKRTAIPSLYLPPFSENKERIDNMKEMEKSDKKSQPTEETSSKNLNENQGSNSR